MSSFLRKTWPWLVALLLIAIITALLFFSNPADEDLAWAQAQQSGVLRVALDASYPPFEFVDGNDQVVGLDVDLAQEIGRRMGFDVVFVNVPYDVLFDQLQVGGVELLVSGLVIAPEFAGKADFSIPYFNAGEHLVLPQGSPLRAMDEFGGLTLAVELGSGGDVQARQWQRRLADLTVLRLSDPGAAVQAVLDGEADAALIDAISARAAIATHPQIFLGPAIVENYFGIGMRPDADQLQAEVNRALEGILADGTMQALLEKWFGLPAGPQPES